MSSLLKALEKGESRPVWEEMSPCVPDFKSVLGSMEYVVCERWCVMQTMDTSKWW